jgi:hypothetical protein
MPEMFTNLRLRLRALWKRRRLDRRVGHQPY